MARKAAPHPLFRREQPKFVKLAHSAYHADKSAVGRSGLWTFRTRRRSFEAEFIDQSCRKNGSSKEMDIGTLAHAGLLEPESFSSRYAVYPREVLDKRGWATTNDADKFKRENEAAGLIVVKQEQLDTIRHMVDSVIDTLGARGWLDVPSLREQAVYWNHPATGIRCKAQIDWLIVTGQAAYVIDFKTTADASPDAWRFRCEEGPWLQDPHYSEGVLEKTGLPVHFLFAVVERDFPHATTVQRLSAADRIAAADSREQLMLNLADCLRRGDWAEPWESVVSEISLRPFCYQ